jgi:unsaturated chondroitin disaccharide hydrolase
VTVTNQNSTTSSKPNRSLTRAFDLCVRKTRHNIQRLADEPKAAAWAVDGNYFAHPEGFNDLGNWTTSFITGMALIAWRATPVLRSNSAEGGADEFFLQQLLRLAPAYRAKAFNPKFHSHHDMGFLYSLYSVALYKLTGDKMHREVGLQAAAALALRFNHPGNFIRAWGALGTDEQANMAIIDCMMNLPLLFWAAQETGDQKFRDFAIRSADTTLKHFIRVDDSVYHAFRFDLKTGAPVGGDNYCGRDVETHWARGTGWAIYGFAIAHRYTGDKKYLDAALRLARKFNQELNGDVLPVKRRCVILLLPPSWSAVIRNWKNLARRMRSSRRQRNHCCKIFARKNFSIPIWPFPACCATVKWARTAPAPRRTPT